MPKVDARLARIAYASCNQQAPTRRYALKSLFLVCGNCPGKLKLLPRPMPCTGNFARSFEVIDPTNNKDQ